MAKFVSTLIGLFLLCTLSINAQIRTIYSGEHIIDEPDKTTTVDEIDIYDNYTMLKLTISPKVFKNRVEVWTSPETYLKAGDSKLVYLGVLSKDKKTYHSIEYNEHYGWNNVSAGTKLSYTLVFAGCPYDDVDFVSLKDDGKNYHGYQFYNLPINNRHSMETVEDDGGSFDSKADSVAEEKEVNYVSGKTITTINLRENADKNSRLVSKVIKGSKVIYDLGSLLHGYVWAYVPDIDQWGYALKDALAGSAPMQRIEKVSLLQNAVKTKVYNPTVTVFNKSTRSPMVRIDSNIYYFKPYEKKKITLRPGILTFFVTSPGVRPLLSKETLKSNYEYDFVIFVKTYTVKN